MTWWARIAGGSATAGRRRASALAAAGRRASSSSARPARSSAIWSGTAAPKRDSGCTTSCSPTCRCTRCGTTRSGRRSTCSSSSPAPGDSRPLKAAVADLRENGKWKGYPFFTAWGLLAATAEDLARQGPLAPVWLPLTGGGRIRSLAELAPCAERRRPWPRRSAAAGGTTAPTSGSGSRRSHRRHRSRPKRAKASADLRLSGTDGLMPDPHDQEGS